MTGAGTQTAGAVTFGSRLRALRRAANLSQEELAERAHLTVHAVSALERGTRRRPYPHTVRALADALNVSDGERAALVAAVPTRRTGEHGTAAPSDVARPAGLPVPATRLVARETEVAEVSALVRDPARRIVTLTGTGGVGKTRLSIAVARAVESTFTDGVVFVELAPLLDANLVLPAVADAVGAGPVDGHDPVANVAEHLRGRHLLLVLDNVEHLLAAVGSLARLVEGSPGLTVLASSRAALRVRGETEYVVPPLALPGRDAADVADLAASPAGSLFLERARDVGRPPTLTAEQASAVGGICHRVAGIPLAIELAAARCRVLDPVSLLARLDEALAADGARDLPARQRTMRAALDWSYTLLGASEQSLFRLVAVFTGGFTLEEAEAVAERSGSVRRSDVVAGLEALTEHSLVVADRQAAAPRFHLLEPVAQYARGLLEETGEAAVVGAAHTAVYLDLAERAAPQYLRAGQVEWLARVDAEHANLSAALERALATGAVDDAGRLGWALWLYWWLRGHLGHGRRLMEAVLARDVSAPVRTNAEIAAATMAFAQDDIEAAGGWWQSALDRATALGDPLARANARAGVGLAALADGDVAAAGRHFREAIPEAEALREQGEWLAALTEVWLGTVSMLEGDLATATRHVHRGLASARRRGDRLSVYIALYNLSQITTADGDLVSARTHLEEGLRLSIETGDHANLAYFLDALAVLDSQDGGVARVPVLLGAAQAIRETVGSRGYGYYRPDPASAAQAVARARAEMGDDAYDDALDRGRSMAPEEAVTFGVRPPVGQT